MFYTHIPKQLTETRKSTPENLNKLGLHNELVPTRVRFQPVGYSMYLSNIWIPHVFNFKSISVSRRGSGTIFELCTRSWMCVDDWTDPRGRLLQKSSM